MSTGLLWAASVEDLHLKEAKVSDKLAFRPGWQSYCTGGQGLSCPPRDELSSPRSHLQPAELRAPTLRGRQRESSLLRALRALPIVLFINKGICGVTRGH